MIEKGWVEAQVDAQSHHKLTILMVLSKAVFVLLFIQYDLVPQQGVNRRAPCVCFFSDGGVGQHMLALQRNARCHVQVTRAPIPIPFIPLRLF